MSMMRCLLAGAVALVLGATTFAASDPKVQVCHIPPGNPGNYHTLTVSASALKAHLAHGDLAGPCGDFCAWLCDDGDACTQDAGAFDPATGRCACTNAPVDCTASTCLQVAGCDPRLGCQYTVNAGAACDSDGNVCTGPDVCDAEGVCQAGLPVPGCCRSEADCPSDLCQESQCLSNQCSSSPTPLAEACTPADACWTAVCDPVQGCVQTETVCPATDPCHPGVCDPATGACSNPPVTCPAGTCGTLCGVQCVNTDSDPLNCGACGVACGADATCQDGACVLTASCATGQPGGTCSTTTAQACAYDSGCPAGETCEWSQPIARFVDNGDGTVTDLRTCLTWEQKVGTSAGRLCACPGTCTGTSTCSDPHDLNNGYSWTVDTAAPFRLNGSAVTVFLAQLNAAAFAGHADWRLPTSAGLVNPAPGGRPFPTGSDPELESILTSPCPNASLSACIDPVFGPMPASPLYWSSSPIVADLTSNYAWAVGFIYGEVTENGEWQSHSVRAVRGGPGVR